MEYIIETRNLTKKYGNTAAVNQINMHVPKGKIYGLLGRNGAGKTTTMKMMLRLNYLSLIMMKSNTIVKCCFMMLYIMNLGKNK